MVTALKREGLVAIVVLTLVGCEKLETIMPPEKSSAQPAKDSEADSTAADSKPAAATPKVTPPKEQPGSIAPAAKKDAATILAAIKNVATTQVTDDQLVQLAESETGLDQITELDLRGARLTARGLAAVASLPKLTKLNLNSCPILPKDWEALSAATQLTDLDLSKTPIDSDGLAALRNMTQLKRLNLSDSRAYDHGFAHLTKLTALEEIDVSNLKIEGKGMEALGKKGARAPLKIIRAANTNFGYLGFVHVGDFDDLRELYVSGSTVTDLSLQGLKKHSSLEILDLSHNSVSDAGLKSLAGEKNLVTLSLNGVFTISDVSLKLFSKFDQLKQLYINDSACTPAGVNDFKKKRPDCLVRLKDRQY